MGNEDEGPPEGCTWKQHFQKKFKKAKNEKNAYRSRGRPYGSRGPMPKQDYTAEEIAEFLPQMKRLKKLKNTNRCYVQ